MATLISGACGELLGRMNVTQLAAPILILMILAMMVLPLPAFVLDVFFTFNIAISVLVLLVAVNTRKRWNSRFFRAAFTKLLRLSLNVASTRVVMLEGHSGPDAAGKVIEAFGHFLVVATLRWVCCFHDPCRHLSL
jgi:flagellar biosynthesis protein FlhA